MVGSSCWSREQQVPPLRSPEFLSRLVALANFMRSSLRKTAHVDLSDLAMQEFGYAPVGMTKGRGRLPSRIASLKPGHCEKDVLAGLKTRFPGLKVRAYTARSLRAGSSHADSEARRILNHEQPAWDLGEHRRPHVSPGSCGRDRDEGPGFRVRDLLFAPAYDWADWGCCWPTRPGAGGFGAAGFLGGSAFFPGERIACSVVPSMRGMNSTMPASPISMIKRLMMA